MSFIYHHRKPSTRQTCIQLQPCSVIITGTYRYSKDQYSERSRTVPSPGCYWWWGRGPIAFTLTVVNRVSEWRSSVGYSGCQPIIITSSVNVSFLAHQYSNQYDLYNITALQLLEQSIRPGRLCQILSTRFTLIVSV